MIVMPFFGSILHHVVEHAPQAVTRFLPGGEGREVFKAGFFEGLFERVQDLF